MNDELKRRLELAAIAWARIDPDERTAESDPLNVAIPRELVPSPEVVAAVEAITGSRLPCDVGGVFNGWSKMAALCRSRLRRWAVQRDN